MSIRSNPTRFFALRLIVILAAGFWCGRAFTADANRPLRILYVGEIVVANPPGGGRGAVGIPGLSGDQNAAITALNNSATNLAQAVATALNAASTAVFANPPDATGLKARLDALATAELALANLRATEFDKIQNATNRLNETQVQAVLRVALGGARGGGRGGGPQTNYTYLPGQTLAASGIYFDHRTTATDITPNLLNHYDAAIIALPGSQISPAQQRALDQFRTAGHGVQTVASRPTDEQLRASVPTLVSPAARAEYQSFLAARAPVHFEKKAGVANYENRPEILPAQDPLSPQESMKHTQVPADFELKLFASEPEIGRPIAFQWDERGRLWIVESVDYPSTLYLDQNRNRTGEGNDRIKICEDTDGDGRADKFTVFADKLNMATSLVFVNGGIIVSELRQFVFLKDTNGDEKADERAVLFPNSWGVGDTHAIAANLSRGFDNWLYGSVGYSGFNGTVGGVAKSFAQGVYRFTADGSAMEFLYQFNNNTWGFGQNAAGDAFGSTANANPSFFGGIPANALPPAPAGGRGGRGAGAAIMTAKALATGMRMHPNTPNVRQVDQLGGYTAASNHRFMLSDALPERFQGNALVCEATCKLIGIMRMEPSGAGYAARDGLNLLASSDEWMSPVYADIGPDGAVWVADFYNFIIQHNPTPSLASGGFQSSTGPGAAHVSPLRDNTHGRVYRVVWKDGPATPIKSLAGASTAALVNALDSGNIFWRQTAQRLIVDGKKSETIPAMKAMVKEKDGRPGAIHAMWALQGLGALDRELHRGALLARDPALRRNAVRALESSETGSKLFFESGVVNDPDLQTRLAAFVKLAQFPTTPAIQTVVTQLRKDPKNMADEWLGSANAGLMLVRAHQVPDAELDAPALPLAAGDPMAGELLLRSTTTAACIACHSIGGTGGVVGPALDGIAARKDEAYIRQSVLEPNAKLAEGYEKLGVSPMPPMALLLKPQQIEDIIAYLLTLKTPAPVPAR